VVAVSLKILLLRSEFYKMYLISDGYKTSNDLKLYVFMKADEILIKFIKINPLVVPYFLVSWFIVESNTIRLRNAYNLHF
jgi:hypothetical protein